MSNRPRVGRRIARRLLGATSTMGAPLEGGVAIVRILREIASDRRLGLVVLVHRVDTRDGDPRRELVPAVGVARFRRQLRWMRRLFRPVPAADIHAAARRRRRWHRVPIALTLDDEWSTHVTLALPALRAERMPATFFLTGAKLDNPATSWWELLQEATDRGLRTDRIAPGADLFAQAAFLTRASPETRDAAAVALTALVPAPAAAAMPPNDIRRLAREHDTGFHTLRHDPLDTLTSQELQARLTAGRGRLEQLVGRPLTLLAYPHGAAGRREADAAREAGFALAFTTNWAPVGPGTDRLLIGRVEPGAVSTGRFLGTLVGVLAASRRTDCSA
jgi:peptidoglycan/xylan/chitin deacetylase (PgdA/CDA1 family)